jgi:hypothetical protein
MEALWALIMPTVEMEKVATGRQSFLGIAGARILPTPSEESIKPL